MDGKVYYYRIRARDTRGQLSVFYNTIKGIPGDSIPPAPPKGLKIDSTTHNISYLNWQSNTEEDLDGYNIYRSKISNPDTWGEPIASVKNTIHQYIDKGLDKLTTYYYVITAFDEVPNESGFSDLVFGTTLIDQYRPEINNSIADIEIPEDTIDNRSINLLYWFKDENNDPLVFWVKGNENISVYIYKNNGTVVLIPTKNWNGIEKLTFYASDGNSNISDVINVTVTPVNDPPGPAIIMSPLNAQEFENGTKINFSAICFDPDIVYGDILTFEWSSNLSGKFGNGANLTNIILQPGKHKITLNVTDIIDEFSVDMINIIVMSNLLPNNTDLKKPEINDTKNDTKPSKDKGLTIDMVVIGVIIVIIIAIIILMVFLFIIRKKQQDKEIISEPQKDQLEIISQESIQESKPPPIAPEQEKPEQHAEISKITVTHAENEIESVNTDLPFQKDLKPETEQMNELPKQENEIPLETPESQPEDKEQKADAQHDTQNNKQDNSPTQV
jgi:hypothetical protein